MQTRKIQQWIVCLMTANVFFCANCQAKRPKLYDPGLPTYIYTPANNEYSNAWYTVEDRTFVTFDVKACHSAFVALSRYSNEIEADATEIVLGANYNQISRIQSAMLSGGVYFTALTPNILSCQEYRSFWISWKDNLIEVGHGPVVGQTKFMNCKAASDRIINAFGIKSAYFTTGMWKFSENTGDILRLYTMESVQWNQFWKVITNRKSLIFHVAADAEAHVLLSRDVGNTNADSSYRISIGANENTVSGISKGPYAPWKVTKTTEGILSGIYDRSFWISWYFGTIRVGYGTLIDRNTFMVFTENYTCPVRAVSISTAQGNKGFWRIHDNLEAENYVYTPPKIYAEYDRFWIEGPQKQAIKFSVAACNDVSLIMCTEKEMLTDNSVEVVLNNTKSFIRYPFEVGNLAETEISNVLSCLGSRDFWITWQNKKIKVGLGVVYDEQTLMQWTDLNHVVNAVGISTFNNQAGLWTIRESAGQRVVVQTSTTYAFDFWRSVMGEFFTTFKVRACNDAHILLSNSKGRNYTDVYELIIGGWNNQRSAIKDTIGGRILEVVSSPDILNCTKGRDFWVSWNRNYITVGRGKVYWQDQLIRAGKTKQFTVNYVSISTGWQATGEWMLDEDIGDIYTLYTGKIKEYGQNWLRLRESTTSINFDVQACSDAHILLANDKDKLQTNVIEIVIGGMQNSQSEIRIEMGGAPIKTVIVKELLECYTQWRFWISWAGGQIKVGKSHVFGQRQFLEYSDPRKIDINYASFSTGGTNSGLWSLTEFLGQWWNLRTIEMPRQVQQTIWRSVQHRRSVVFSVKCCWDATIDLTPAMNYVGQPYVFKIGGLRNTISAIERPGRPYDPVVALAATPGILDCNNFRDFWIAWYDGVISFGRGKTVSKDVVLNYQDLTPLVTKALHFYTPLRGKAEWLFPVDGLLPPNPPVTEGPTPTAIPSSPIPPKFDLTPGQKAGIVLGVIGAVSVAVIITFGVHPWIKRKRLKAHPTQQDHLSIQLPESTTSRLQSCQIENNATPLAGDK